MIKNNIQILLSTWIHGDLVGYDEFGNQYYQDKRRQVSCKKYMKRWIIYAGEADSATIPVTWHGWLHAQCDTVLIRSSNAKIALAQQKNSTRTLNLYQLPVPHNNDTVTNYNGKSHQAWKPNKD